MILRHATPLRNLPGIARHGLLCRKSRGRQKVVWLHSAAATPWAELHTVRRHGGKVEAAVIVEVDVPRRWLRRHRGKFWYCPRDIPPDRFRRLITFAELARPCADHAPGSAGGRRATAR